MDKTTELKLCINCRHYELYWRDDSGIPLYIPRQLCAKFAKFSIIDGTPISGHIDCEKFRQSPSWNPDQCGIEARHFEPMPFTGIK